MPIVEILRNLWTRVKKLRKKKKSKEGMDTANKQVGNQPVPVGQRSLLRITRNLNKRPQYVAEMDLIVQEINELIRKLEEL